MLKRVVRAPANDEWRESAACRVGDVELHYPAEDLPAPERRKAERAAVLVCHTCPVQLECLAHALVHGEVHGIWGGMTERERRHFARGVHGTAVSARICRCLDCQRVGATVD